jgi:hypothetical protein
VAGTAGVRIRRPPRAVAADLLGVFDHDGRFKVGPGSRFLHDAMFNIMRSIFGTCQAKGINPNAFLVDALNRFKRGLPLPSLVNIGKAVDQKYVAQAEQERKDLDDAVWVTRRARKAEIAQTREKIRENM